MLKVNSNQGKIYLSLYFIKKFAMPSPLRIAGHGFAGADNSNHYAQHKYSAGELQVRANFWKSKSLYVASPKFL